MDPYPVVIDHESDRSSNGLLINGFQHAYGSEERRRIHIEVVDLCYSTDLSNYITQRSYFRFEP
jgi:hypothetical protein